MTNNVIANLATLRYKDRMKNMVFVLENLFNINVCNFFRTHVKFGELGLLYNSIRHHDWFQLYVDKYIKTDFSYFLFNALGSNMYISGRNPQNKEQKEYLEIHEKVLHIPHGVVLIEYFNDHIDVFHFASNKFENDRINPILQQLNELKKFRNFFRREMVDVINNPKNHDLNIDPRPIIETLFKAKSLNFANTQTVETKSSLVSRFIQEELYLNVKLTTSELKVIQPLIQGKTIRDIARTIFKSPRTVEKHVASFKNKLGCQKTTEAIYKAKKIGLIDDDNLVYTNPCLIRD